MTVRLAVLALSASLVLPSSLQADAGAGGDMLDVMRHGGMVLLIRHATTVPGTGDPPEFTLGDCATQRNLSERGKAEARALGVALREAGVPVAAVKSSRWCRGMDTATLAFDGHVSVEAWPPLDSFFAGRGNRDVQTRDALAALGELPTESNWVWITHQVNISALTGEFAGQGEVVVARPENGRLRSVGKWRAPAP